MDAFLNVTRKIQAYGDKTINSNPRLRYVDWNRDNSGVIVSDPKSQAYEVDPGATLLIFNGTRSTTIGVATAFDVSLSSIDPSRYRFTWNGGSNPGLRTDRALTLNTIAVTFTVNPNNTVNVTVPSLAPFDFTGMLGGDIVFIPGPTTGDGATPFSVLNQGFWQVLAVITTKNLVLARPAGVSFDATGETQTLTSNSQFQAFSANGVQVGDVVDINNGFPLAIERAFPIVTVTSTFFEVESTLPLPVIAGNIPGTTGMVFYTNAKSYLYIEVDQEAAVQVNGDTGQSNRLSPIEPGNSDKPGWYEKFGVTWALSIVNRSSVSLNAVVITAEPAE